jgi:hypothetical protein
VKTPPTSWTSPAATAPASTPTDKSRKIWSNASPSPRTASAASPASKVGYFDLRLRYQSVPEQINQDGRADPLAFAYHYDCSEDQVFDRLSRYESRIQREYSRCLKETPEQPASTTSNPRLGPAEC